MTTLNVSSCNYQILLVITKISWAIYLFMDGDNPEMYITLPIDVSIASTLFSRSFAVYCVALTLIEVAL